MYEVSGFVVNVHMHVRMYVLCLLCTVCMYMRAYICIYVCTVYMHIHTVHS